MKIREMSTLPQKAGLATLDWREDISRPVRIEDTIQMVRSLETEFYLLKGDEQFLLLNQETEQRSRQSGGQIERNWLYFGGTDEAPFLVELNPRVFGFRVFGEEIFFEALKPRRIHELEIVWGRERTKRQGDIFAYNLPFSWVELMRRVFFDTHCLPENTREHVFGTRHMFTGRKADLNTFQGRNDGFKPLVLNGIAMSHVYEGTIEAPDHAPLILEGPHILAQTGFLQDARDAD